MKDYRLKQITTTAFIAIACKISKVWVDSYYYACCPWSHGLRPTKLHGVPSATVRVPSHGQLLRVSRQSRLSADDKGVIRRYRWGHRFSCIYLKAEENPQKPQLGDRVMIALQIGTASNEVSCLQVTGRITLHIRDG